MKAAETKHEYRKEYSDKRTNEARPVLLQHFTEYRRTCHVRVIWIIRQFIVVDNKIRNAHGSEENDRASETCDEKKEETIRKRVVSWNQ